MRSNQHTSSLFKGYVEKSTLRAGERNEGEQMAEDISDVLFDLVSADRL
jgi:hypothetical protein